MKRKDWLTVALIMMTVTTLAQGQGRQGHGPAHGSAGQMGGGQMGGGQARDMQTIHALFSDHQKIRRTVKQLDNGIESLTESDDPQVQALITSHSIAMKQRLEKRQPIRMWDPLFAALFEHAGKIEMEVIPTAKGVRVVETSKDPDVIRLIQAHAAGVSEFVREGMSVMHKSHPLPGKTDDPPGFIGKGDGVTTCPVSGQPVDRAIKHGFDGRTVYFCSEDCRQKFLKSPESYLKRM